MRIKIILVVFSAIVLVKDSFPQENLYIPRNIQLAYEKGTRSRDGKPGEKYWQNSSEYIIDVDVEPSLYLISGSEEILYSNNSPDTLKKIVLRLYPNVFKKGSARDYEITPESVNDGVTINKIMVGSNEIDLENKSIFRVVNTIATVHLTEYIPPKSSVNLSIEWSFNLSYKATLRMGVYDSTTIFVGYWYPQIAVYDDIDGWDYNNYGGQEEFYNDFSSFEVNVTLPNNFGVWATGELQNPEEVFSELIYTRYLEAQKSDTVLRIITSNDLISSFLYNNDDNRNTWKYKASGVTDFAFAISDKYLWDGLRAVVDNQSNQSVFVQAIYPADSPDFHDVAEISKNLVIYFSKEMPAVKFPFPSIVAFNNGGSNGGGMEFPMMINDGSSENYENTVSLTAHEIAHQYFPFFIGINEKKYAFMDESMAVMLIFKYMENLTGFNSRLARNTAAYEKIAGTEDDVPEIIPSLSLTYSSYGNSAYNRASIAYEILRDMLGDKLFLEVLQEYIRRWNGKHPIPYDFYFTFNEVAEQNLNWFWKPWFFEIGYPDLAFESVSVFEAKTIVKIKNNGTIPVPIKLNVFYKDETNEVFYYKADVWKSSGKIFTTEIELSGMLKEIKLGDLNIPDSNRENNIFFVH